MSRIFRGCHDAAFALRVYAPEVVNKAGGLI